MCDVVDLFDEASDVGEEDMVVVVDQQVHVDAVRAHEQEGGLEL